MSNTNKKQRVSLIDGLLGGENSFLNDFLKGENSVVTNSVVGVLSLAAAGIGYIAYNYPEQTKDVLYAAHDIACEMSSAYDSVDNLSEPCHSKDRIVLQYAQKAAELSNEIYSSPPEGFTICEHLEGLEASCAAGIDSQRTLWVVFRGTANKLDVMTDIAMLVKNSSIIIQLLIYSSCYS